MPTIGDLITTELSAAADQATKSEQAAAADQALVDANAALTAADAGLATGLMRVGPAFTIDEKGQVRVFFADSSTKGFHMIAPAPVDTKLPEAPAPAPDPGTVPDVALPA